MKKEDLMEVLKEVKDGTNIVIGKCFLLNKEDEVTAILDIPVIGTAYNPDGNELRFMLNAEDVDGSVQPKDIKYISNIVKIEDDLMGE